MTTTYLVEVTETNRGDADPRTAVTAAIAVMEAGHTAPIPTFPAHAQSVTFGADMPTAFLDALIGLAAAQARHGINHPVLISQWSADWTSVDPPLAYVLQGALRRDEIGVIGLKMEDSEGYLLVTPADENYEPIPGAGVIIIPSIRIERMHLPRIGLSWARTSSDASSNVKAHADATPAPSRRTTRRRTREEKRRRWLRRTRRAANSPPDMQVLPTLLPWTVPPSMSGFDPGGGSARVA